jgi:hypothetical protein
LSAAQALQAQGILFVAQETRDGKTATNQIQMDKNHVHADSNSSGQAFIFDGTSQVMRMLNLERKTYVEINKADLEKLGGQMNAAMAQMEERMKNMPPEQRAMVEQMMKARGGLRGAPAPAQAAPVQYKPAGSDKVGQWSCTKYEGFRGQEKVAEVCAVDPKDLGLTPSDFEVTKQMADFYKAVVPQGGAQQFMINPGAPEQQGFSGVPVRRTNFENGKVSSVTEIKEFRRQSFPVSTFDVPAGFTKQAMGQRQ